jgi:hypothetical protein
MRDLRGPCLCGNPPGKKKKKKKKPHLISDLQSIWATEFRIHLFTSVARTAQ